MPRPEKVYRLPRIWSNDELKKFAHLYTGHVINVSAWQDMDKQGSFYRSYFRNAASYTISNFEAEKRGFQGYENEVFLDLEADLDPKLKGRFEVVFNHTTLEHIFDFQKAFQNLCFLSSDTVIIVVPFMQEMHGVYGDFWRFSPQAIDKMFNREGFELLYLSHNDHKSTSVYIYAIASLNPNRWKGTFDRFPVVTNPLPALGHRMYKKRKRTRG